MMRIELTKRLASVVDKFNSNTFTVSYDKDIKDLSEIDAAFEELNTAILHAASHVDELDAQAFGIELEPVVVPETKAEDTATNTTKEEPVAPKAKAKAVGEKRKTSAPKKPKKFKGAYDRTIKAHKDELGKFLRSLYPDLGKDISRRMMVQKMSEFLDGKPLVFLEEGKGTMNPTFQEFVKRALDEKALELCNDMGLEAYKENLQSVLDDLLREEE